ncbi:MAG: hypothetical protein JRG74_03480 [Deltaproteobacteria bacterium]|nr:hypothetical protein [Deltaproteobacteria bacterium]
MAKNQVFTKQNKAVFSNLHCFVGTTKRRRLYLDTLAKADKGDLEAFVRFVGESLVSTQKVIIEAL